jgi:carboxymethylenebutenolidase
MTQPAPRADIPAPVFALYDAFAHGRLSRRDFIERLGGYTVAGVSGAALAALLMPNYAQAQQVAEDDPRITVQTLTYDSPNGAGAGGLGPMGGLLALPAEATAPVPGVLVIHENRGLNPYVKDVARRLAVTGYAAFAPDALHPLGGWPGNDDDGRTLQSQRDRGQMLEDFVTGAGVLAAHPACNGAIGVVGFCFGGAMANMLAVRVPTLKASVPYYGGWPPVEDAVKVQAPLLVHLAETDERINAGWPAWEAALTAAGKSVTGHIYPGTQHGFHNDSTPRFNPEAAALSWERTLTFFAQHLQVT